MPAKYCLRFFFDHGCSSPLWSASDATRTRFGYSVEPAALPISDGTRQRISSLCAWFDKSLNWKYPPDPGPWRQFECDRFNQEAEAFLESLRIELGGDFEVVDEFQRLAEDPELGKSSQDPTNFTRASAASK